MSRSASRRVAVPPRHLIARTDSRDPDHLTPTQVARDHQPHGLGTVFAKIWEDDPRDTVGHNEASTPLPVPINVGHDARDGYIKEQFMAPTGEFIPILARPIVGHDD